MNIHLNHFHLALIVVLISIIAGVWHKAGDFWWVLLAVFLFVGKYQLTFKADSKTVSLSLWSDKTKGDK